MRSATSPAQVLTKQAPGGGRGVPAHETLEEGVPLSDGASLSREKCAPSPVRPASFGGKNNKNVLWLRCQLSEHSLQIADHRRPGYTSSEC